MRRIALLLCAALLCACGGNGTEDECRKDTIPVDCKQTPEQCS